MIGKLSGSLDFSGEDHILLDVGGVGYIIYCSERTLLKMPSDGAIVTLYVDLLVREDNLQLFGFLTMIEKELHKLLMSVQGVGAKASMAILGALGSKGVSNAIALGDWGAIKAAKGIGPKTAQRVVNELKEKVPKIIEMEYSSPFFESADNREVGVIEQETIALSRPKIDNKDSVNARAEALSALTNLGYSSSDAVSALAQLNLDNELKTTSELIVESLKILAPKI